MSLVIEMSGKCCTRRPTMRAAGEQDSIGSRHPSVTNPSFARVPVDDATTDRRHDKRQSIRLQQHADMSLSYCTPSRLHLLCGACGSQPLGLHGLRRLPLTARKISVDVDFHGSCSVVLAFSTSWFYACLYNVTRRCRGWPRPTSHEATKPGVSFSLHRHFRQHYTQC